MDWTLRRRPGEHDLHCNVGGELADGRPSVDDGIPLLPFCPSTTEWREWTAVPRSWALQTWIEMVKYGVGTNTMLEDPVKPREHDRHVLDCRLAEDEQAVFK